MRASAPAKINLFLHILGRRPNGYHEMQSLVVFAAFGDEIEAEAASDLALRVTGSRASAISNVASDDNLIIRAAKLLRERARIPSLGARISLRKEIPAGAGLGGGSSDAAATLKLLNTLWNLNLPLAELEKIGLSLGADVPVCLRAGATFVGGIGEELVACNVPRLHLVLAFTGREMPTAPVFKDLKREEWSKAKASPSFESADALALDLRETRNDLEAPALRLQPRIGELITEIRHQPGCMLARMSGSGSACFGIFASEIEAFAAAENLARHHGYWAVATRSA
ncbi:MAG: 4-(cytidine 5'-diphospho)-2-C-methyl-D-erythritol kinase [Alphaproteobacteria bacterium]